MNRPRSSKPPLMRSFWIPLVILLLIPLTLALLPGCGEDSGEIEITYTADILSTPAGCTELCVCVLCDQDWFEVDRQYAYLYIYYEIEALTGGPFVLTGPDGKELWRLRVPLGAKSGTVEIPMPPVGRYHFHGPFTFLGSRRLVSIYGL